MGGNIVRAVDLHLYHVRASYEWAGILLGWLIANYISRARELHMSGNAVGAVEDLKMYGSIFFCPRTIKAQCMWFFSE